MNGQFNSSFFVEKRRKLQESLGVDVPIVVAAHGLVQKSRDEAYPFRQESNFWYLSGINEPNFILVIDSSGDYLIAPEMSEYFMKFSGEFDQQKLKEVSGVSQVFDFKQGWDRLAKSLDKTGKVACPEALPEYIEQIDLHTNPASRILHDKLKSTAANLEITDIRQQLAQIRSIKTSQEIKAVQKATDESVKLHQKIKDNLASFKTEKDIVKLIKTEAINRDLQLAYAPIAASGKNACILHYEKAQSDLSAKEPVLVDAAFASAGYCSDITRTYCLEPSERYGQVYNATLEVQEYALSLVKPGILLDEYEDSVRKLMSGKLKSLGLIKDTSPEAVAEYYPHRTSHFLGLDAHDPGDLETPLQPGMVLTVEPGIYIPKESIGVRIEDTVLVTEDGSKNLSASLVK